MLATYLVAIFAILFAAVSAMTWIYIALHFDSHPISKPERAELVQEPTNSARVSV